jgi:hypothetical protein
LLSLRPEGRDSNETQNGVADKPHPAERSKARPHHIRGQLSNDFDRVSEASIQSLLRPKESPADKQEIELIRDMKARGILFESDDDSDDGPEVPAGRTRGHPYHEQVGAVNSDKLHCVERESVGKNILHRLT